MFWNFMNFWILIILSHLIFPLEKANQPVLNILQGYWTGKYILLGEKKIKTHTEYIIRNDDLKL